MSVVVVGSANLDLFFSVRSLPGRGETVLATGSSRHLGGKGNNQAIAAARAGADTTFIGAVGADDAAELIIQGLKDDGARALVRRQTGPSGQAMITVDDHGENTIVVDPGSNAALDHLQDAELAVIAAADLLLMQLELPVSGVTQAAAAAAAAGTTVVLNAAPMTDLPTELIAAVDLLVVNQTEAEQLTDGDEHQSLLKLVDAVVITLGADGALVGVQGEPWQQVAGHRVQAVDSTGAGDTFCGTLVAELARSTPRTALSMDRLISAVRRANAAAALSVLRPGAVPSIPRRAQVTDFLDD